MALVRNPILFSTYFDVPAQTITAAGLINRIRPRWKRSECRAELIALPYQNMVRRLENSTLGEMLERLLEHLSPEC